jgi:hypothetical protein
MGVKIRKVIIRILLGLSIFIFVFPIVPLILLGVSILIPSLLNISQPFLNLIGWTLIVSIICSFCSFYILYFWVHEDIMKRNFTDKEKSKWLTDIQFLGVLGVIRYCKNILLKKNEKWDRCSLKENDRI